jgi:hypothetical protein
MWAKYEVGTFTQEELIRAITNLRIGNQDMLNPPGQLSEPLKFLRTRKELTRRTTSSTSSTSRVPTATTPTTKEPLADLHEYSLDEWYANFHEILHRSAH